MTIRTIHFEVTCPFESVSLSSYPSCFWTLSHSPSPHFLQRPLPIDPHIEPSPPPSSGEGEKDRVERVLRLVKNKSAKGGKFKRGLRQTSRHALLWLRTGKEGGERSEVVKMLSNFWKSIIWMLRDGLEIARFLDERNSSKMTKPFWRFRIITTYSCVDSFL